MWPDEGKYLDRSGWPRGIRGHLLVTTVGVLVMVGGAIIIFVAPWLAAALAGIGVFLVFAWLIGMLIGLGVHERIRRWRGY
jgi:hypothetical protein